MARDLVLRPEVAPEEVEGMWLYRRIQEREDQSPEWEFIFHVPNGGFRHYTVAAKLKAQGVRPGVYDYIWLLPRGGYHGCVIELKDTGEGHLHGRQPAWRDWAISQGYFWAMRRGAAAAYRTLEWYYSLPTWGPAFERAAPPSDLK